MFHTTSETLEPPPVCCFHNGPIEDPWGYLGCIQNHDHGFEVFAGSDSLGVFANEAAAVAAFYADWDKIVRPNGGPSPVGEEPDLAPGQLRAAASAAIVAYEKSGRMVDAALAWAAHGFPVFPVTVDKRPVPARDKDANGKPIPGTGGFKKATTDPIQIRAWWRHHEHLIGLPTGFASGVCCIDVDTSEDHADGVAEWDKLVTQHEPIVTREHRSATGGPHLIFDFDWPTGCSSGQLPKGIEVKGQGGYIVVPPSRRKGRAYTVHHDIDPGPQPLWLRDLITAGRQRRPRAFHGQGMEARPYCGRITADVEEVTEAMAWIPNDENVGWHDWKSMALRLYASLGDAGFKLFDTWSKLCIPKYDQDKTLEAWEQVIASPPDHTGAGAVFKIARHHGWTPRLFECTPTYPASDNDADTARREAAMRIDAFWQRAEAYHAMMEEQPPPREAGGSFATMEEQEEPTAPPVEAMRVDTGIGKTEAAIISHARARLSGEVAAQGIVYTVDRHLLGDKIHKRITALGTTAKTFRGRGADDPDNLGQTMCLLLKTRVALARKTHADINKTCCRKGDKVCPLLRLDKCSYQRQAQGDKPEVWITAHDMLFHAQPVFGRPAAVIIDERMWHKGILGIEDEDEEKWEVPLDSLIVDGTARIDSNSASGRLAHYRHRLGRGLLEQDDNGGVRRKHLATALSPYDCDIARKLEWKLLPELGQHPGMSEAEIAALHNNKDAIDTIQHARRVIRIWETVGDLLKDPSITVSGCLTLRQSNGQRVVAWKGVDPIRKQFQVPTLLLDATLPPLPLLRVYHRQVEMTADIRAAMPAPTRIRQVIGAPTSSNKLDDDRHLDNMQRYILQRWIETGRGSTLVVCQQKVENALRLRGLPPNITLAHYNNIAGEDDFKAVRLQILIGRTAPGPRAMELQAAALSGRQPVQAEGGSSGFIWYDRVTRGIRQRDGRGIRVFGDQHPDPFVEMIRWQGHEGGLIQADGRGRGVNRTAEAPLNDDWLFDTCLPITVDEVVLWQAPSVLIMTAIEGVMLTAPVDMVRLWPKLWPNEKAAYRTIQEGVPALPGFEPMYYQLKGPKMKQRLGHFDRTLIPDPRGWLEGLVGPLAGFEVVEPGGKNETS